MSQPLNWIFWINFFTDFFLLQLFLSYTAYLLFSSKNVYYTVFYFFLFVAYSGLFLCLYQSELFTGFLWLVESVIIFISLLLLFFIKATGTKNNIYQIQQNSYIWIIVGVVLLTYVLSFPMYFKNNNWFNEVFYYSDFYEATFNTNVNDFVAFLISYYLLNSYYLISVGLLILIGSLIVINLHKQHRQNRVQNFSSFFKIFNFFKQNVDSIFLRQQNLVDQEVAKPSTRIFKKKFNL